MRIRMLWAGGLLCGCVADTEPTVEAEELPGEIVVSPSLLDFGEVGLHEEASATIAIANVGEGPLEIFDVALSDDTRRPHWRISGGLSGELAPGEGLTLEVVVRPQDLSNPDVDLLIRSDDPVSPEVSLLMYATVEGEPDIRLDPGTLSFGAVPVGSSVLLTARIGNDGTADLQIDSVMFTGGGANFALAVNPENTTITPQSEDGLVGIEFTPQSFGAITDNVTITSNDPDTPGATLILTGQGVQ